MSNGVFIYPKGYKGTTPVNITGSAVIPLSKLDVFPVKSLKTETNAGNRFNPTNKIYLNAVEYPLGIIFGGTSTTDEDFTTSSIAIGSYSSNLCYRAGGYNASVNSMFYGELTADNQYISLSGYTYSSPFTMSIKYFIKNKIILDHATGTNTIRKHTSDLTNISDFSTWGSQFNSTQYTQTSNIENTTAVTGNYFVVKTENIPEGYSLIAPLCAGEYFRYLDSYAGPALHIWNFKTNTWNNVGPSGQVRSNARVGPSKIPMTGVLASSAYINSGVSYFKLTGTSPPSWNVFYLGLLLFNKYGNVDAA